VKLAERLRGPMSLLTLSASYVMSRPRAALPAARAALAMGIRVRRAPILRSYHGLLVSLDELDPVCSLVSDTHVVAPRRSPCELDHGPEQWPWGPLPTSHELTDGLRRVLEHLARHAPRTVVWCGDEVDSGEPDEWREWKKAVDAVPGLAHRLVPGNHDICFNRPFDHDYELERRAIRERAYQRHAGRLADFPVVDTIVGNAGPVTIVLLDSCRHRSTHVLSNAIGMFGDEQLAELARVLGSVRGPVLCVAHHHVWRDARFLQPDDWFNVAVDADRLAAVLEGYRRRDPANHVLVCHGHRHVLTAGTIGDGISVVGLPSTTLGDKAGTGRLDAMMRYAVAGITRAGMWGVALQDVGPLVAPADRARSSTDDYVSSSSRKRVGTVT
jgi:hypothetical protein